MCPEEGVYQGLFSGSELEESSAFNWCVLQPWCFGCLCAAVEHRERWFLTQERKYIPALNQSCTLGPRGRRGKVSKHRAESLSKTKFRTQTLTSQKYTEGTCFFWVAAGKDNAEYVWFITSRMLKGIWSKGYFYLLKSPLSSFALCNGWYHWYLNQERGSCLEATVTVTLCSCKENRALRCSSILMLFLWSNYVVDLL